MMQQQIERYEQLLVEERCVKQGRISICVQNDTLYCHGPDDLSVLAEQLLFELNLTAVIVAEPLNPFPYLLAGRTSADISVIIPEDSESKSFLHDIPIIRQTADLQKRDRDIRTALQCRKGCIVEGVGMVSQGALTLEQAYICWSSLMHATTIKYLQDLLATGPILTDEISLLQSYRESLNQIPDNLFPSKSLLPESVQDIMNMIASAGQQTVQMGLVDSFFGNISWATDDTLYISQTSARLDELITQIDPIPFNCSTTAGLTASSELPAHKAIVMETGCSSIVHGHPKFPVIMSFFCIPTKDEGIYITNGIPVVRGEGGMGGLAESLPRAFRLTGANAVIVQGHGVFAISRSGFSEALTTLADIEKKCRDDYFLCLQAGCLSNRVQAAKLTRGTE